MRIIIVGPGRAGMALARAALAADHRLVAIVGKDTAQAERAVSATPGAAPLTVDDPMPEADLLVVATRDDVIAPVAEALAPQVTAVTAAVHLSGLSSVHSLQALASAGLETGAFHPLQTLPTPEAGAARLHGAWIGITAEEPLRSVLHDLAASLGASPFDIADRDKALYHAGAAAAANFGLATLAMAEDLLAAAGVPFEAVRPLVQAVVDNAFEMGSRPSLTGPISRGDVGTVRGQLDAVAAARPDWLASFGSMVLLVASIAGRRHEFEDLLASWESPETESSP
jgi:predicted short-subunit dehydrogenase-like oxidoreductase (DUF2520 family)